MNRSLLLALAAVPVSCSSSNENASTITSFFSCARSDSADASAARLTFLGTVYE